MRDVIRVALVDPSEGAREEVRRLLGGLSTIWVAEVFSTFSNVQARIEQIKPDLTIVGVDHNPDEAIALIQQLTHGQSGRAVLPVSRTCDSALILRSVRAGAREFLTIPAETNDLQEMISRLLGRREEDQGQAKKGPQVISITGASGGVGCTSVAVNLAASLAANKRQESILLDLDLVFGSVDAALDLTSDNTISSVLKNYERLDLTLLKRSLVRHSSGLYVLPRPVEIDDAAKVDAESLQRLLGLLKASFQYVIIDTSKGLQTTDFTAFEMSDLIIVVMQLELTCLRNTARLIELFRQFDGVVDRVQLLVNHAKTEELEISLKKAEQTLKLPIRWQVPHALRVFQTARIKGTPVGDVANGCRAHQAFLEMARAYQPVEETEVSKPKRGIFAALF
jgi:pilus assembly protein CpaE